MFQCSWFLIYMTLPSGTVSSLILEPTTRFNKVNIDLKTYVDIDEEDNDADLKLMINNQKLKGDVKFIISNNHDLRREFTRNKNKRFTKFIQNAVVTLQKFSDRNLKYFWSIFDEEIRKYHYQNCKFFELTRNPAINKLIVRNLESMKDDSVDVIRDNLAAISDNIENHNRDDESKKKLIDLINALYNINDISKFKKFLLNIETFNIYNGKINSLRKIIREGIRSIIFDHYSELHKAVRDELKYRIERYFQNILNPKTYLLAEITNSMFLDIHVSGEQNNGEFTSKSERGNLRTNQHNNVQSSHTKNENKEKLRMKKIETDSMEQTIIKSEIDFDKMFAQTKTPNLFNLRITKNKNNKKEQNIRILKNKKSSEENEPAHVKYLADKTKLRRKTLKWYLTQSPKRNILRTRTLFNNNVATKANFKKGKKPPFKIGLMEIVTMRPFSPRLTTFFGNMHYMIELNNNMEKDFSGLRAKAFKAPTKIPGILFGKVDVRKQVIDDIKKVTTESIQEKATSVKSNFRFDVQRTPFAKNKNTQFEGESTVGFYKRRVMNQENDKPLTKPISDPVITNIINRFEETMDIENVFHDSKEKQSAQEKNYRNLRINIDDYIKRISTTGNKIKENTKNVLDIKSKHGKKYLNEKQYYPDNFIRGKMSTKDEFSAFKTSNAVSSSVKTPISDSNFIKIEHDNKDTNYPNLKSSEKHHSKSSDDKNINIGAKFINNKKTHMNSNNPVLYNKAIEKMALKQGHSNEIKLKSEIVSYRKGDNQQSHNNNDNLNNNKGVTRKEIHKMYGFDTAVDQTDNHLPPKDLHQSLPEQVDYENQTKEISKNFNNKRINLEEFQVAELNNRVKKKNRKQELLNSRFTIESRKNTRIVNSHMADKVDENKVSTNQNITTRKSKWSKIKNYVFKSHTGKYANTYRFDAEQSHNKEFNIDSVKTNKETSEIFGGSQRSVNGKAKEMSPLLITGNIISTTDKVFHPRQVSPDPFISTTQKDNKMYQTDFGTLKVLSLSKEITALELEKLEPIAIKKDEESIQRVLSERKAQRQAKLDLHATVAGRFGARRLWNQNIDNFDEGQTETAGQIENTRHVYQHVPQPKDSNIYLYMEKN